MLELTVEEQNGVTYAVYSEKEGDVVDQVTLNMLTNNKKIPGLSQLMYSTLDGKKYFKYDVSGMKTVSELIAGQMDRMQLSGILSGIADAFLSAGEFMIDSSDIIMDKEYVYVNPSNGNTSLLCIPVKGIQKEGQHLDEFIKDLMFSLKDSSRDVTRLVNSIQNYYTNHDSMNMADLKVLASGGRPGSGSPSNVGASGSQMLNNTGMIGGTGMTGGAYNTGMINGSGMIGGTGMTGQNPNGGFGNMNNMNNGFGNSQNSFGGGQNGFGGAQNSFGNAQNSFGNSQNGFGGNSGGGQSGYGASQNGFGSYNPNGMKGNGYNPLNSSTYNNTAFGNAGNKGAQNNDIKTYDSGNTSFEIPGGGTAPANTKKSKGSKSSQPATLPNGEKPMTKMYLLMHYSKENSEKYKEQQEMLKNSASSQASVPGQPILGTGQPIPGTGQPTNFGPEAMPQKPTNFGPGAIPKKPANFGAQVGKSQSSTYMNQQPSNMFQNTQAPVQNPSNMFPSNSAPVQKPAGFPQQVTVQQPAQFPVQPQPASVQQPAQFPVQSQPAPVQQPVNAPVMTPQHATLFSGPLDQRPWGGNPSVNQGAQSMGYLDTVSGMLGSPRKPSYDDGTTLLNAAEDDGTTLLGDSAGERGPYLYRMDTEEKIYVTKNDFVIGREEGVDYVITGNKAVSHRHATIFKKDGDYFIRDLDSTNHTYVNQVKLPQNGEEKLTDGSRIKLADIEFEFDMY